MVNIPRECSATADFEPPTIKGPSNSMAREFQFHGTRLSHIFLISSNKKCDSPFCVTNVRKTTFTRNAVHT